MKINRVLLEKTVFSPDQVIQNDLPKIAFIGRSNVGKSSLINKLLNRKKLAKVSSKPGKTVSINYYQINDRFYFVDLPGYGYAKASKSEMERVKKLLQSFFSNYASIAAIFLLIDVRRGFLPGDLEFLDSVLEKKIRILTILTKCDKVSLSNVISLKRNLHRNYNLTVMSFTIKSENAKNEVLENINKIIMERC